VNERVYKECPHYIELDTDGNPTGRILQASYISDPENTVIAVTVEEGEFISCNSKEEAQEQAEIYA
jgi:hypothetical protein